jgi:glycosyltransferase involved in cell wall biosynthesis
MTASGSKERRQPLKVAIVHNLSPGGAHRRLNQQVALLAGRLSLTEYVLQGAAPVTDDAHVIPLRTRSGSSPSWMRPLMRYTDLVELALAYRRLAKIVASLDADVIWLNPCSRLQTPWLGRVLARRCFYYCDEPRRIDYDPTARSSLRSRTRLPYWPLRRLERYLDRSTATNVSAFAANSVFSAACIQRAYGRDATIVPCGISEFFAPAEGTGPGTYVLSVGTLIPSKGHGSAIEVTARSGLGYPLHIVSPRENDSERGRLEELAANLGVELHVHIGVSDLELRELYQNALVTMYLARNEPFGLASIEAQACGSPVIALKEGGLPETLLDGKTGFLVSADIREAAQRLRELASDSDLWTQFSVAAAAGRADRSWARSADQVADCLSLVSA